MHMRILPLEKTKDEYFLVKHYCKIITTTKRSQNSDEPPRHHYCMLQRYIMCIV